MYSYEDRIRAVELYIKLGKRVRPTIRQLGYPTKKSLKGWYNEYQLKLDLSAGYAGREPKFSQAQKAAAIEHYLTHDRCIAATMRALGYPGRGTLTKWIREAFPEARKAVVGSVGQRRYPESLKRAGVMALCTRQESAQAFADKLGVCLPTLYNWKNQLLGCEAPASMKHTNRYRLPICSAERNELFKVTAAADGCRCRIAPQREACRSNACAIDAICEKWVSGKLVQYGRKIFRTLPPQQKALRNVRLDTGVAMMVHCDCDIPVRCKMPSQPAKLKCTTTRAVR